jgi:nucleotide-binding universal stress UspA family protein
MNNSHALQVLFLTNFSDSCYRAIPSMAQLTDEVETRLTIMHVVPEAGTSNAVAERKLASFFPEADSYPGSRRQLGHGDVVEAAKRFCAEETVDLIVAPSSDPLGMPRFWTKSLRSRLLSHCDVPVWTMSHDVDAAIFSRGTRNVGCWVDLEKSDTRHISLASELASKTGAQLHLLHALPEIEEDALLMPADSVAPLYESGARQAIQALLGWMPSRPEIHVATGSLRKVLPRLTRDLQLDLMFVSDAQALREGWFGANLSSAVDRATCPVVCVQSRSAKALWHLRYGSAHQSRKNVARKAA